MSTRLPFDFSDHHTPWARDTSFLRNIETDLPPEDLYGRWRIWGQQQKMDPLPKQPSVSESSSKDDYNFAALQANKDLTDWKVSFVVENDGVTDKDDIPDERPEILEAECSQGLAAGKLWIDGEQAETSDGLPFSCSGFCLEDNFFISTQHFLRLSADDPAASTQESHLAQLMNPKLANVKISISRESCSMKENGSKMRAASLIYHDRVLDIAIFRLKDSEKGWKNTVRMEQLGITAEHRGESIFTVGYAGSCDDAKALELYRAYWTNTVNAPQSSNDAVRKQKLESLKQKGLPPPDQIFKPFVRAIAFGHMEGGVVREILDDVPRSHHEFYHHSVPGWFGMSGSMIGVMGESRSIKIIGLFKGGAPKEISNRLVPLSAKTIQKIREVIYGHLTTQTDRSV